MTHEHGRTPVPPPIAVRRLDAGQPSGLADAASVATTADIAPGALLGDGTIVWHLAQLREEVVVGAECTIGRGAYLGPGVVVGKRCKIQNHALLYEPAVLEDGVFVGPAAVLTNDVHPRATTPDGRLKTTADWSAVGVRLSTGASVGARAVCVAPVTVGRWAMVAAGAVVTHDVPDHALVVGVPARQVGWVGEAGRRLQDRGNGTWECPVTGRTYRETDGVLSAE